MHVLDGPIATPLADAALSDEESALVYQEIVTRRIRMTIDPDFSDYDTRANAEKLAEPFVRLTEQYIRASAEFIDQTLPSITTDASASFFHAQQQDMLSPEVAADIYSRMVTQIWTPMPYAEELDYYWIETLCSAILSNYLVGLVADVNTDMRARNLWRRISWPEEVSLTRMLTGDIEPVLGERVQELIHVFQQEFDREEIASTIAFASSRIDVFSLTQGAENNLRNLDTYRQYAASSANTAVFATTYPDDPVMFAIDDWITAKKALWGQAGEPPRDPESAASPAQPHSKHDSGARMQQPTSSHVNQQIVPPLPLRTVWFATNREEVPSGNRPPGSNPGTYFTKHTDKSGSPMHYGRCELRTHSYHGAQAPRSTSRTDLFIGQRTRITDESAFFADVNAALASLPDSQRQIVIYVHGFNTPFDDAVINTGHIALGLEFPGVAICYSWPASMGLHSYNHSSVKIHNVRFYLRNFIAMALGKTSAKQVHLIAHSLGCQALMETFFDLSLTGSQQRKAGQILFAAPDLDIGQYNQLAKSSVDLSNRVTMYASDKDQALKWSARWNNAPRAGLVQTRSVGTMSSRVITIAPGIDTVDTSQANTHWLGHDYYLDAVMVREDMAHVVRTSDPPRLRRWLHGLLDMLGREYWLLKFRNLRP